MKTPSRLMPPYLPEQVHWWKKVLACSVLGLMLYVLLSAITRHPWMLALFAALAVTTLYSNKRHRQKLMGMTEERAHEGICTFARSFDRNQVDTWVIRAVHDELQQQVKFPEGACPLRASDRLEKDLKIDPDDIEDLIPVVAQRAGRSLEHTERNPFYKKISTAGDVVLFINAQPHIIPEERLCPNSQP
ncbi:hypothetical protein FY034_00590 [Trichlorobacter lovleyi]|uniref:hypothetical protein n=1 Tax=Trichlorobacter lovleyi TaxID=313985 RepID=UPI00224020E7|nr:hypothetical protein [Trichlorobacter lovleyi]QOX77499.1 hypothetical protein FY034_00590 [Trichlorobacter lovleyi]